jgi:hypothetical protein
MSALGRGEGGGQSKLKIKRPVFAFCPLCILLTRVVEEEEDDDVLL